VWGFWIPLRFWVQKIIWIEELASYSVRFSLPRSSFDRYIYVSVITNLSYLYTIEFRFTLPYKISTSKTFMELSGQWKPLQKFLDLQIFGVVINNYKLPEWPVMHFSSFL